MARRIVVAPLAQNQISAILKTSTERFGEAAARRYADLIAAAFTRISEQPAHPTTKTLAVGSSEIRLFHIRHVRRRSAPTRAVHSPRHIVAYRFDDEKIEVAQVLHDRMDILAQLR